MTSVIYVVISSLVNFSFSWLFGTYVLFLSSHGLSQKQINWVNAYYMIAAAVLSPIMGALADKFGKRKVFVLGNAIASVGFFIYSIGKTFNHFVATEMLFALVSAMTTTTLLSWLYQNLDSDRADKAVSFAGFFRRIVALPSAWLGSVVSVSMGLSWPWIFAGISLAVTTVVSIILLFVIARQSRDEKQERERKNILKAFIEAWREKPIRMLIVVTFLAAFAFPPIGLLWQPILSQVVGEASLGKLAVPFSICISLGSLVVGMKMMRRRGLGILMSLVAMGVTISFSPLFGYSKLMLFAFLIHEIGLGMYESSTSMFLNQHIEDERKRTTINSLLFSVGLVASIVGLAITGEMSEKYSLLDIWGVVGVVLVIAAIYLAVWRMTHVSEVE